MATYSLVREMLESIIEKVKWVSTASQLRASGRFLKPAPKHDHFYDGQMTRQTGRVIKNRTLLPGFLPCEVKPVDESARTAGPGHSN
jgi:hypothetical protein